MGPRQVGGGAMVPQAGHGQVGAEMWLECVIGKIVLLLCPGRQIA